MSILKTHAKELHMLPLYQERIFSQDLWLNIADELIRSSIIFEPRLKRLWGPISKQNKKSKNKPRLDTLQGVYFMLIAYAIENYCKAVIVKRDKTRIASNILKNGKLPISLTTHNLFHLVKKEVGLNVNIQEENLLYRLERNAVWSSRYPAPVSFEDIKSNKRHSNGNYHLVAYLHVSDIENVRRLVKKIKVKVISLLNNST